MTGPSLGTFHTWNTPKQTAAAAAAAIKTPKSHMLSIQVASSRKTRLARQVRVSITCLYLWWIINAHMPGTHEATGYGISVSVHLTVQGGRMTT